MKLDLYPIRDEKTILKNKRKGWYWHYIDGGYSRPRYRDRAELIGNADDFPGLNHLYLRFNWCDVNPEKGVYDFSYLDSIMDEWGKRGYTFSMRMCSFQNFRSLWDNCPHATPNYVREAGAKGFKYDFVDAFDETIKYDGFAWEPDYADPIFLGYLEEALAKLGEKYGNDPRLEYIDVGSFGKFGEGWTTNGIYEKETLIRHIDITRRAFENKLVLVNDDMLRHDKCKYIYELADYCAGQGLGIRDDSICDEGHAVKAASYDTLSDPRVFDRFNSKFPVDIELCHAESMPEDTWRQGYPAMESFRRVKATYAGFHDYPLKFYEKNYALCEYAANRLGYWFRPDSLDISREGGELTVTNLGWAPSYCDFEMRLTLECENGELIDCGRIAGSKDWHEGASFTESFSFKIPLPSGAFGVKLGLFDTDGAPIKMALKSELFDGKYYNVGKIEL